MPRTKRWKTQDDADAYLRDLEDVYSMDIEMDIKPAEGYLRGRFLQCTIQSWWKCDERATGPLCYHTALLKAAPQEEYMSSLVRALTDFTYRCMEVYISAIPSAIVVRVKR
jgi:hypothetical protein